MKKKTRPPLSQKSRFKSGSAIIASVALVAFGYAAVRIFAATGSASLYLTPAIGTYAPGQAITVQVYVNTGGSPVNAVEADFSYPTSKLTFNSFDFSNSVFGLDAAHSGGSGTVKIARGTNGGSAPYTGTGLIGTVHFTALASGSASLAFLNSSAVVSSSTNGNILTSTAGAAYTIAVAPTPTPTPAPTHTPAPTPGGTKTPVPSPTPKTSASPTPSPTASTVAGGSTPSPSVSASPESTSKVVTVPTTSIPKRTDVLGVKLAGIPVLVLAGIVVLLAAAGVVFFMAHGSAGQVTTSTDTPTTPPAQAPSSQPIMPQTSTPSAPSQPATPPAPSEPTPPAPSSNPAPDQPTESQDKENT